MRITQVKKYVGEGAFTLIELLVVMVVLLSTGMVIGAILFSSLRGATKASVLTVARQNGEYAISQIVKTIRNAKSFGGVSGNCNPDDLDPHNPCAGQWITDCSASATEMQYKYINITDPNDNKVVFSCEHSLIKSNGVSLIDDTQVHVDNVDDNPHTKTPCYFTCLQSSSSDSPTIGINFSIIQSKVGALSESSASVPFSTSVKMRNSLR